jgi:hypothetical protein
LSDSRHALLGNELIQWAKQPHLVAASHHQFHNTPPPSHIAHKLLPVSQAVVHVHVARKMPVDVSERASELQRHQ